MSRLHTSLLDHTNPFFLTPHPLSRRISIFPPVTFTTTSPRRNLSVRSSTVEQQPSDSTNPIPALATSAVLLFLTFGGVRSSACFASTSVRIPPAVTVSDEETLLVNFSIQGFFFYYFFRLQLLIDLIHLIDFVSNCIQL